MDNQIFDSSTVAQMFTPILMTRDGKNTDLWEL